MQWCDFTVSKRSFWLLNFTLFAVFHLYQTMYSVISASSKGNFWKKRVCCWSRWTFKIFFTLAYYKLHWKLACELRMYVFCCQLLKTNSYQMEINALMVSSPEVREMLRLCHYSLSLKGSTIRMLSSSLLGMVALTSLTVLLLMISWNSETQLHHLCPSLWFKGIHCKAVWLHAETNWLWCLGWGHDHRTAP